jgi:23S rRNA G2445 N2-methylase RlmL
MDRSKEIEELYQQILEEYETEIQSSYQVVFYGTEDERARAEHCEEEGKRKIKALKQAIVELATKIQQEE